MQKSEVEQLLLIVKLHNQEALNMKLYKNGIRTRKGTGAVPELSISAMSDTQNPDIFNKLMEHVPQEVLERPLVYEEENIKSPVEFVVAFYGASANGSTGEDAKWTKSTGIRLLLDLQSSFRHPILSLCDHLATEATELTNAWYFDVMVHAVHNRKSTRQFPHTLIAKSPDKSRLMQDFLEYINQIKVSSRQWDITTFANDAIYLDEDGHQTQCIMTYAPEGLQFQFEPLEGHTPTAPIQEPDETAAETEEPAQDTELPETISSEETAALEETADTEKAPLVAAPAPASYSPAITPAAVTEEEKSWWQFWKKGN